MNPALDARLPRLVEAHRSQHSAVRQAAESATVRTDWYRGPAVDVEPLETLRMGDHPGAPLTKAPRRTRDTYCYWFDAAGDIRARLHGSDLQGQFYEEFFTWLPEYDPIGRLTRVLVHEEERVGHARSHEVVVEYDGQSETPRTIDRIFPNGRVATIFGAV